MADLSSQIPDPTHLGSGPWELVNVSAAFIAVAWFSVALRVWVRGVMIRSFGWDDWTILLTMVAFTVQCTYVIRLGLGEMHPEENENNLVAIAGLVTDVIALTGAFALTSIFLKISLGLFFLRIIIQPWQRRLITVSLVVYTLYALSYFGVAAFGCGNPAKFFEHTIEGKCVSIPNVTIPMSYVQTALNAAMDWLFVALPINTLWHLNMPRSTKFWASLLIVLGALGSVASLIRLTTVKGLTPGHEFFRQSTSTAVWATIEPGLGIAAASFATLRPMFKRCLESTRTNYSRTRSGRMAAPGSVEAGLNVKGIALSPTSAAKRAGFRPFASSDSDVELTSVIQHEPEKMDRGYHHAATPPTQGIWVKRTATVDG